MQKNINYLFTTLYGPKLEYDWINYFSSDLSVVSKLNKYGFIDKIGNVVIPLEYDRVYDFKEGYAAVQKNGKYGFIDKIGNVVIPLEYDNAICFCENYALVQKNNKYTLINNTGKEIITSDSNYKIINNFQENLARVTDGINFGFINNTGNIIIPLKYSGASSFNEGLAAVWKEDKCCYINKTGEIIFYSNYSGSCDFHEGLAAVYEGYIDDMLFQSTDYTKNLELKLGEYAIKKSLHEKNQPDIPYQNAFPKENDIFQKLFNEYGNIHRKASTKAFKHTKWGFIDKTGRTVIPLEYEYVHLSYYKFNEDLARVYKNGKHGYINKTGEIVLPIEYDSVQEFRENLAVVKKDGKWEILKLF